MRPAYVLSRQPLMSMFFGGVNPFAVFVTETDARDAAAKETGQFWLVKVGDEVPVHVVRYYDNKEPQR